MRIMEYGAAGGMMPPAMGVGERGRESEGQEEREG